jgi:protein N-terminal glutamine amidohydrolase
MPGTVRTLHDYAPFYCEENVLRLCPSLGPDALAVLVMNASRRVEMLRQRAGGPAGTVLWDYHAFAITRHDRWLVWDFDTTLGLPVSASEYLGRSFARHPAEPPAFRVMSGADYVREFRSDRSHMRRADGTWAAPPPPWPPCAARGGLPLMALLDPRSACLGEVVTLAAMRARFGGD